MAGEPRPPAPPGPPAGGVLKRGTGVGGKELERQMWRPGAAPETPVVPPLAAPPVSPPRPAAPVAPSSGRAAAPAPWERRPAEETPAPWERGPPKPSGPGGDGTGRAFARPQAAPAQVEEQPARKHDPFSGFRLPPGYEPGRRTMAEGQRVRAITVAAVMMGALAFGTSLLVLWLGRDVASQAEVQLASARRVEQIGEAGATFKAAPVARPVAGPSGPKFGSITVIIDKPGNFDNISVTCTSGYREQFRVGGGTVVASGIPVGDKCTADLKGRAESPDFPVRAGGRYTCTSGVNTRCSGG